jgi:hypothetical protein
MTDLAFLWSRIKDWFLSLFCDKDDGTNVGG